jgi:hypothetical protein
MVHVGLARGTNAIEGTNPMILKPIPKTSIGEKIRLNSLAKFSRYYDEHHDMALHAPCL